MQRAVAYLSDIIIGRTGDVIGRQRQREAITAHAEAAGIEIVAWFEDEMYALDPQRRPALRALLAFREAYDIVLVERVWAFSRRWPELEELYGDLKSRGKSVQSVAELWDALSQMSRRVFDPELRQLETLPAQRRGGARLALSRPSRLHFAKLKGRV